MLNVERAAPVVRVAAGASRLGSLADPVVRILAVAFMTGQLLDAVTTHVALDSGRFAEANPIFAGPLTTHPALAFLVKLLLGMSVLTAALTAIGPRRRRVILGVLAIISLQAPLMNALRMAGIL
jgi:Domain of unknown function (DUF5658)